jgi:hypothetical protein
MSTKIIETNNYSKFLLSPFNRDVKRTRWLKESLLKFGWIDSKPMDVKRLLNGKLEIRDGHHRFVVAMELGIAAKYVETSDEATAFDINMSERPWSMSDYLQSRIREGKNPAYGEVEDFSRETGIAIGLATAMLCGYSAGSGGGYSLKFKKGQLELGDRTHANTVGGIVKFCRSLDIGFASNPLFVQALSKVAWVEEFDPEVLKKKISAHHEMMKKQASTKDYIDLLEEIYNRKSQNRQRLPLSFLAGEMARKRNMGLTKKVQQAPSPKKKDPYFGPVASRPLGK